MKILRNTSGLSIIELMIVVAIISILAAIFAPVVDSALAKARYSKVVLDMETIAHIASVDNLNQGDWAGDEAEGVLPSNFQPYLQQWPSPPCPGWTYDWENWLDANGDGIIQISMRPFNCRTDPIASLYNGVLFYYPVASYGDGSAYTGYASILTPPDKHLYCNE